MRTQTDKPTTTASASQNCAEWKHPITGETRAEMHAKRTKVTPQVEAFNGTGKEQPIPAEKPILKALLNASESFADIPAEKPTAPNIQFAGSPEQFHGDTYDPRMSQVTPEGLREDRLIAIAQSYKAHAARLAECLKECISSLDWTKMIIHDIPEGSSFNQGLNEAKQALSAYESEAQP